VACLNVALLQLEANGRDASANLERGLRACREAKVAGAHVVLFPEMWSIGYDLQAGEALADLGKHAIDADDAFLQAFAALAAELDLAVAVTFLERWPDRPRDTVALFDRRGRLALTYAKVHTCDWDTEASLTPGDGFPVCELETAAGVVRVGAMICFDLLFPEAARVLMLEGAELILVPNACEVEPWRMNVLQTRAIENMVAVALANYPGADIEGHSCAFDPMAYPPEGDREGGPVEPTVVRAGREPGIYLARFDLDRLRRFREVETQGDAYRKPSTYGPIVRTRARPPFVRKDARR
jgi:predicted amidohydrolase